MNVLSVLGAKILNKTDTILNLHQVQKLTFSLGIVLVCVWKVIIEPIYFGDVTYAGKGDCYAKMTTLL